MHWNSNQTFRFAWTRKIIGLQGLCALSQCRRIVNTNNTAKYILSLCSSLLILSIHFKTSFLFTLNFLKILTLRDKFIRAIVVFVPYVLKSQTYGPKVTPFTIKRHTQKPICPQPKIALIKSFLKPFTFGDTGNRDLRLFFHSLSMVLTEPSRFGVEKLRQVSAMYNVGKHFGLLHRALSVDQIDLVRGSWKEFPAGRVISSYLDCCCRSITGEVKAISTLALPFTDKTPYWSICLAKCLASLYMI